MNIKTKAQFVIEALNKALADVNKAVEVMNDADISTCMWAEISGIQNNLNAVIKVLEVNEDAAE